MQFILYFGIYSFLGWVCETIYCSILQRRFINRGFLTGPVCPVYGFGAMAVIALLGNLTLDPVVLFIVGVILATVVEYVTAALLEYLFHAKWWDYSRYKYNYKGRICLLNSLLFGGLVLILMLAVHPRVIQGIAFFPIRIQAFLTVLVLFAFVVDTVWSVVAVTQLNIKMKWLHIKEVRLSGFKAELGDLKQGFNKKIKETLSFSQKRILLAFPYMRHKKYDLQLRHLKERWLQKLSKK